MPKSKEFVSDSESESGSEEEPKAKKKKQEAKPEKKKEKKPEKEESDDEPIRGDNGEYMFPLSSNRFATVSEFKGKAFIGIREFYEKDGKQLPGRKGIALNPEQWNKLKGHISQIDKYVKKL